jgi:hypothetical protein
VFSLLLSLAAAAMECPEGSHLEGHPPPAGEELKCVLPDGSLHGPYKHWYSNGQLMQLFHYDHGREHGKQQAWWPNGQLMMEGVSMDGKRYQGFRYWDISGQETRLQIDAIEETR